MSIGTTEEVEYRTAIELYCQFTDIRRQDIAFITTAQGAVLTIIGTELLKMSISDLLLSVIAVVLLVIGLNSERRLTAYMKGYMERARDIEDKAEMSLLRQAHDEVLKRKGLISNALAFPCYYGAFVLVWVVVWVFNILSVISC